MKRSSGWVLVFAASAAFLVEGCGTGAPKDTRAQDEATIRAYSRPQAKLPTRRTLTRSPRSMPTMPLLSATTALRRRRKKRCEPILGNRFWIRARSVGKLLLSKWRARAIWPTNTAATRSRPRKNAGRAKYKRGTTYWYGESRPAAIGRSRSIRTPRIRRPRRLRRFRHLPNNPRD